MPFKVCSCPKRDMQREDSSYMPRKRESSDTSYGKRPTKMIKTESSSPPSPSPSHSIEPPFPEIPVTVTLTMPTKESMLHVLRCAHNEVAALMSTTEGDSNQFSTFVKKIDGLIG